MTHAQPKLINHNREERSEVIEIHGKMSICYIFEIHECEVHDAFLREKGIANDLTLLRHALIDDSIILKS